MLSSSTDAGNFLHKILLTNIQVTNLCKTFVNSWSANIILLKIQMSKKKKEKKIFSRILLPSMKLGLLLIWNVLQPLSKIALTPLGLTAKESAAYKGIYKNVLCSEIAILKILNEEMEDIMKMVKWLEVSGLLTKGVTHTTENKTTEQNVDLLVCC